MNKTININLAGIFFHIDEDAFIKLQAYLDSVKHSITDPEGREEIIRDIEARIAELFQEKTKDKQEVVGLPEVEAVIAVMGQPEDYQVDDELFEDEPEEKEAEKTASKKLFRDTDNSYIAGVSSGLGHYFGIDPIWLRLLWILLVILSSGTLILAYLAFWVFVPEAKTTAEKLYMRGEPVNISNIEKKVKEGFESVAGKARSVDYEKYGKQAKSGAARFFEALGDVIVFCLNVFVKLIGLILLLFAGSALISLLFGMLSIGVFGVIEAPWIEVVEMANIGAPLWLLSLLSFFAFGIPMVFLFILGLKILVSNLKSIGTTAKLVLLGLWLISIFVLGFFGIRQATERAFDGEVVVLETLPIQKGDTLFVNMRNNKFPEESIHRSFGFKVKYDDSGKKILFSRDIQLEIISTKDSLASISVKKSAVGSSFREATNHANNIFYTFDLHEGKLLLNSYLTAPSTDKFRDQDVDVKLYLPEGSILFAGEKTHYFHEFGLLGNAEEGHFLKVRQDAVTCLDCPEERENESAVIEANINDDEEEINVKIDEDGIQINTKTINDSLSN